MSIQSDLLRGLEEASQKQEKEIVIELKLDRILHYIGVYLIFLLAAVAKVSELAGNNITCYPANSTSGTDRNFIMYITAYCWESSRPEAPGAVGTHVGDQETGKSSSCDLQGDTIQGQYLMKNPSLVKRFVHWMPYIMMLEALLLAIPSAWWHMRVGSRLIGHMKFMKLLLNEIYESVKLIKAADFQNTPYDADSYYLNDWRPYEPDYRASGRTAPEKGNAFSRCLRCLCCVKRHDIDPEKANDLVTKDEKASKAVEMKVVAEEPKTTTATTQGTETIVLLDNTENTADDCETNSKQNENRNEKEKKPQGLLSKAFVGEMLDRHLFSMICYENFSSLEHHPYILSIFQLTRTPFGEVTRDNLPMKQAILRQLCHKNNFTGRFLIHSYVWRHVFGTLISLALLGVLAVLLHILGTDSFDAESFQCNVIYHEDMCIICTMHRKRDMFALLVVNVTVVTLFLAFSLMQWCFIRASRRRASSFYFEDISDASSLALETAFHEEQCSAKKAD